MDLSSLNLKILATKIVTILDCCFSGAVGAKDDEGGLAKSARSDMDRTFKEGDGKCVLASSLAGQVSYKKKGEPYSLFTYYLLEGLKGGNGEAVNLQGYVTPYTLGIYIYNRITTEDRRQRPITKTATSGEIILAHYPELVKRQEEASRRSELDIEQIRAELEKNPQNQVDVLRKMLSKINRDEVLSTTRTKDFIMFKLGELTHGEIGYNPNGVSVEPLD